MGQPAVSHAIARLETALGVSLVERRYGGVQLTPIARSLVDRLRPAFESIDRAVAAAAAPANDNSVSLSVSTSLASWWLLPRLTAFKRSHPDVALRIVTADGDDSAPTTLDLWIPLGLVEGSWERHHFCDEVLVPVASPDLATTLDVTAPADLARAPLLHLEERYRSRFDWRRWFEMHGINAPTNLGGDRTNDYSVVIQAAIDGQGVALGWWHIVHDLVADGRLTALTEPAITDHPFEIVSPADHRLSADAIELRDWLVSTMGRTPPPRSPQG